MDSHGVPTAIPAAVTIGGITFDRVVYDREGDVLYLHVGDPASVWPVARWERSGTTGAGRDRPAG